MTVPLFQQEGFVMMQCRKIIPVMVGRKATKIIFTNPIGIDNGKGQQLVGGLRRGIDDTQWHLLNGCMAINVAPHIHKRKASLLSRQYCTSWTTVGSKRDDWLPPPNRDWYASLALGGCANCSSRRGADTTVYIVVVDHASRLLQGRGGCVL